MMIDTGQRVELKQAQELFFLREPVVSSYPRSEPETAKTPFVLSLFGTLKRQPTWYLLILFDTELILS